MINRITQACIGAGAYTISVGSMNPALVLSRLLDALAVLNPGAYRALVSPGGAYASIPPEMLSDASHSWWETPEADRVMHALVAALNAAAPTGFCCVYSDGDRFELARIDEPSLPCEPLARREPLPRHEPPPPPSSRCVSRVRCRVVAPSP